MSRKLFWATIVMAVFSFAVLFAEPAETPCKKTCKHSSNEAVKSSTQCASMSLEQLNESFEESKDQLKKLSSANAGQEHIYQSMQQLCDIICVAAERARRHSDWNYEMVKDNTEQRFDETVSIVNDYLLLIANDGPIYRASKRISDVSLKKAQLFSEKSGRMKLEKYQKAYRRIAGVMEEQGKQTARIWTSIAEEQPAVETLLTLLRESKEFYIDVKSTFGANQALEELEETCSELDKLIKTMVNVQNAVHNLREKREQKVNTPKPKPACEKVEKEAPEDAPKPQPADKIEEKEVPKADAPKPEPACEKAAKKALKSAKENKTVDKK